MTEDREHRVLVVDDEDRNVTLLRKLLTSAGYPEPLALTDPRQALPTFIEHRPDLVLLDLHMPHLDGFAVLEQLRDEIGADELVPVIVLTADVTSTARDRALRDGAHDFLTKPFDRTELLLRCDNLLAMRGLHEQVRRHNAQLDALVEQRTAEVARFKRVFDVLHDPVVMHDPLTLEVVYANAEAARLDPDCHAGARPGDGGDAFHDLIGHPDARELQQGADDARFVATLRPASGGPLPLDVHVQRVRGSSGWDSLVVIGRDRTAQEAAERSLREAAELEREASQRLQALDETRSHFITAVSHELRTPLTLIVGVANVFDERRTDLAEVVPVSLVDALQRGSTRLDRLVTDIGVLDATGSLRSDRLELAELHELVSSAVAGSPAAPRIRLDLAPVRMHVEPTNVRRIVETLLDNAIRYAPSDAAIDVSLVLEHEASAVLRVADRGPGVPDDLKDELFLPFRQGANVHEHNPGTGIGLTVARLYARQHGGDVRLEDRPGGGTIAIATLSGQPASAA